MERRRFCFLGNFFTPNPDQAVYSKVFVSFRGTRFTFFLGEESGSFLYVERQVRKGSHLKARAYYYGSPGAMGGFAEPRLQRR